MVHLSSYLAAVVAGAVLPQVAEAASLNTAAKAAGLKYFGSATDNSELTDSAYIAELSNTGDFGQITTGNSQKWDSIEPSQNTFSYTRADAVVLLAQNSGQILRCHNLVWYNQLPSWVSSGTWTNATLIAALKNHITNEVTHYKGKCYAWDVVNEALNDDGSYRADVFYNIIGPAYIPIAFAAAAAADHNVKLYYNDYNIESPGAKSTAAQNIVKMIKAYGAKIDGVGLQAHFIVGSTPSKSSQQSNIAAFASLGVEVAITELDIRMTLPSTAALLAQQSTDYATTVSACLSTKGCIGITIWDYTDKYSWVPSTFSGQGAACPWDANLAKKPAYNGILSALDGSAATATATATTMKTTTTTPSTSPTPGCGTVAQYGQCGGMNWTGATSCMSPYTCHVVNAYYSQCY